MGSVEFLVRGRREPTAKTSTFGVRQRGFEPNQVICGSHDAAFEAQLSQNLLRLLAQTPNGPAKCSRPVALPVGAHARGADKVDHVMLRQRPPEIRVGYQPVQHDCRDRGRGRHGRLDLLDDVRAIQCQ